MVRHIFQLFWWGCKLGVTPQPSGHKTTAKSCIRTHTGEKHYECDVCDMAFSRKDHYTEHALEKTLINELLCLQKEIFSQKQFNTPS